MVVIRLSRGGSKKKPFYHVVAADKRCPRDGKYLERIGYFNPLAKGKAVRLNVLLIGNLLVHNYLLGLKVW